MDRKDLNRLATYRTTDPGGTDGPGGTGPTIWWDGAMSPSQPFPPDATLADVGEFGLISALSGRFDQGSQVFVGPGDDAAVLRTPRGHVVVSTDLLVEGRHFRREWAPARDIGRKAAASNLSDINAMGGTAHSLTVGLGAPADLPVAWAIDLADGIAEEAALVGASVVGGDLTTAKEVVIAVTVLGTCDIAPVLRSGARAGDVVAMAGRQGWAAAGLAVLARGFRSPRALVEAYQRPQPPYAAGPLAAQAGATSMIDVSDGLLADLGHVAHDSGVAVDVRRDAFELADPMHAVGSALGVDPMQFVLGGGDDHAIVATFPAGTALPEGFTAIGSVGEAGEAGPVVTVDGAAYDGPTGWSHFQ
ncbi:MAG: thiamine-phosphate kinase [Marmoricola sp.]|nr:thiamine-phosphate kinase [Marmoricola sp.]